MVLLSLKHFHIYVDDYDKVWDWYIWWWCWLFDGETWNCLDKRDGLVDNTISITSFGTNGVYWFGSGNGITTYVSEYKPSK